MPEKVTLEDLAKTAQKAFAAGLELKKLRNKQLGKEVDFYAENTDIEDFWRNMEILVDNAGFEGTHWLDSGDIHCKREDFAVDISIFEKPPEQRPMNIDGIELRVRFLDYDEDDDALGIYGIFCDGELGYE